MQAIAIRLSSNHKLCIYGDRVMTFRKACLLAHKAKYRFMEVIDQMTRNMVDYVDLC